MLWASGGALGRARDVFTGTGQKGSSMRRRQETNITRAERWTGQKRHRLRGRTPK